MTNNESPSLGRYQQTRKNLGIRRCYLIITSCRWDAPSRWHYCLNYHCYHTHPTSEFDLQLRTHPSLSMDYPMHNQIHNWFVEKSQDGVDNCHEYHIGREDLQQLQKECQAVLKDPTIASNKLPHVEGFFFGGQDYDEWYEEDLKNSRYSNSRCYLISWLRDENYS